MSEKDNKRDDEKQKNDRIDIDFSEDTTDSDEEKSTTEKIRRIYQEDKQEVIASVVVITFITFILAGVIFFSGTSWDNSPDGVDEDGIYDLEELMQSHSTTLTSESYTLDVKFEGGGDSITQTTEYMYDSNDDVSFRIDNIDGEELESYEDFNSSEVVVAEQLDSDEPEYNREVLETPQFTADFEMFGLLESVEVSLDSTDDSVGVFTIDSIDDGVEDVEEISGEIHIHEDGFVQKLDMTVSFDEFDEDIEIEVSDRGETSVSQPEWYDTAIEETDDPFINAEADVETEVISNDDDTFDVEITVDEMTDADYLIVEVEDDDVLNDEDPIAVPTYAGDGPDGEDVPDEDNIMVEEDDLVTIQNIEENETIQVLGSLEDQENIIEIIDVEEDEENNEE